MSIRERVVLLVGGVGGAKLALGLAELLPAGALTVIVNTADDFEHLGVHISPDVDTVTYTLAGISNQKFGWGIADDTLKAMEMVKRLGGPGWFNLGDFDIGTNLYRTSLLRQGKTLSEVTRQFSEALGIEQHILPMSDDVVRTKLDTVEHGDMGFQEYFVRERWQPTVKSIRFEGIDTAQPTAGVVEAIRDAQAVIFGPSNPFLSIDPIIRVKGIRRALQATQAPVVAVSPIVDGAALKGPAAKLMKELQLDVSPITVAKHYGDLLNGFILDNKDADCVDEIDTLTAASLDTIMTTTSDKIRLADQTLDWIEEKVL